MKVLKTLEKVLVYLACALGIASFALSYLLDESEGLMGMLSFSPLMTIIGVGGVLFTILILTIGTLLYFNKNEVVRKIALGLVISAQIVIFFTALSMLSVNKATVNSPISPVFALVSGILYVSSVLCGFIYYIVNLIKPNSEDKLDPSNDKKIALILKWKKLFEDGIITEKEFMDKRNELLEINE